jgi:hypothetical protein
MHAVKDYQSDLLLRNATAPTDPLHEGHCDTSLPSVSAMPSMDGRWSFRELADAVAKSGGVLIGWQLRTSTDGGASHVANTRTNRLGNWVDQTRQAVRPDTPGPRLVAAAEKEVDGGKPVLNPMDKDRKLACEDDILLVVRNIAAPPPPPATACTARV